MIDAFARFAHRPSASSFSPLPVHREARRGFGFVVVFVLSVIGVLGGVH